MLTQDLSQCLATLFAELVNGVSEGDDAFVLNSGDAGLLRSLDHLTAEEASRSVHGGATVAAHAQHVRYGLSLMNRWASQGGNPFANARWDEAWKIRAVDDAHWTEIRTGLNGEAANWLKTLGTARTVGAIDLTGMAGSIAHLAYHLGAIRQIAASTRGPKDGTFS